MRIQAGVSFVPGTRDQGTEGTAERLLCTCPYMGPQAGGRHLAGMAGAGGGGRGEMPPNGVGLTSGETSRRELGSKSSGPTQGCRPALVKQSSHPLGLNSSSAKTGEKSDVWCGVCVCAHTHALPVPCYNCITRSALFPVLYPL